jgi:hypothetical protein
MGWHEDASVRKKEKAGRAGLVNKTLLLGRKQVLSQLGEDFMG